MIVFFTTFLCVYTTRGTLLKIRTVLDHFIGHPRYRGIFSFSYASVLFSLSCYQSFPPCGFSKNMSSRNRVKPCYFVTFNIILRHIFPENFIEFPQVVQKIWRIFLSILVIFINFHRFFRFFNITSLQRN